MTIPKKKRRVIVVNGTEYEYSVTGVVRGGDVSIFIKNLTTGKTGGWGDSSRCGMNRYQIKPSDIRRYIEENAL